MRSSPPWALARAAGPSWRGRTWAVAITLAAASAVLPACTENRVITGHGILNEQEYAPYQLPGSAVIDGQVIVRVPGGGTFYGADGQVLLLPRVTETERYVSEVVLPGKMSLPHQHMNQVRWATTSDVQGRFRFDGLPAGSYYVVCPVAWTDAAGKIGKAMALGQVTVADGQQATVVVTR